MFLFGGVEHINLSRFGPLLGGDLRPRQGYYATLASFGPFSALYFAFYEQDCMARRSEDLLGEIYFPWQLTSSLLLASGFCFWFCSFRRIVGRDLFPLAAHFFTAPGEWFLFLVLFILQDCWAGFISLGSSFLHCSWRVVFVFGSVHFAGLVGGIYFPWQLISSLLLASGFCSWFCSFRRIVGRDLFPLAAHFFTAPGEWFLFLVLFISQDCWAGFVSLGSSFGCSTKRYHNGTVSGNMAQNLRNRSCLILSHTHFFTALGEWFVCWFCSFLDSGAVKIKVFWGSLQYIPAKPGTPPNSKLGLLNSGSHTVYLNE